jgi:hypothetical protein
MPRNRDTRGISLRPGRNHHEAAPSFRRGPGGSLTPAVVAKRSTKFTVQRSRNRREVIDFWIT